MVYESRVGDVFALGATSWRIEDITHDRVLVTPAPGVPGPAAVLEGRRPRPPGRARRGGRRVHPRARRRCRSARPSSARRWQRGSTPTPPATWSATSTSSSRPPSVLPSDQHPAGRAVPRRARRLAAGRALPLRHARCTRPWALAINARLRERYGIDGQAVASDDGIVIRIPDTDAEPPGGEVVVFDPDEIDDLVTQEVGGSALFASRFRECAARALLLPRRDPGRRSPAVAAAPAQRARCSRSPAKYPSFPIVLEAVRECLQDVYDLPALVGLMRSVEQREVQVIDVVDPEPVAVRAQPAVRLRRPVRLRGRLPHRRAPGRRALPRPGAARRAARPRRAARAARPRGAGRGRGRAAAARPRAPGPRRRGRRRPAAAARPAHRRRGRRRAASTAPTSRDCARRAGRRPARGRGPDRRRGALGRDRGRRPAPRRARRRRCRPAPPTRSPSRSTTRSPTWSRRYARTHGPFTTDDVAGPARPRRRRGPADPPAARAPRAGCSRASSGRPASGAEWCDAEVLRSLRRRSPGPAAQGGRAGRAGGAGPVPARLAARRTARLRAASTACSRWSTSSPAAPVPRQRPRAAGAGRPGARLRAVATSTSSPPPARCSGPATARCPAPTAGCALHLADQAPLTLPEHEPLRAQRAPPGGARRPGARRRLVLPPARPAGRIDRRQGAQPPRCGTSSGPAGSATTPSRRCARSPAPARPATAPSGRRPGPGWPRPRGRGGDAAAHRPARDRRPLGAAAPSSTPTRPGARTPRPSGCSTGTAS